jgi:hypothetical protein
LEVRNLVRKRMVRIWAEEISAVVFFSKRERESARADEWRSGRDRSRGFFLERARQSG